MQEVRRKKMKKIPPAKAQLLSIGEVAAALGLTRRMILNYEDRGLIAPDVKEGMSGNRYYTTDTLTRIRSIRIFQNLGLSLDEIRSYFADETDLGPLIARLEAMRDELNLSIEKLRARVAGTDTTPERVILPAGTVYARTLRAGTVEERKAQLRDVIPAAMRQYGSDTGRRMFFTEFPVSDPSLSTYCIAIPAGSTGEYVRVLAPQPALLCTLHGDYTGLPALHARLLAEAQARGLAFRGVFRHIYMEGPAQHRDPKKFITQVALLLDEATPTD